MKRCITFLAALLVSGTMFGQFHFGPQIGYTTPSLSYNLSDITESLKSSLVVGAFARFGKKIYVEPEINWFTQGGIFKSPDLTNLSPFEQKVTLQTIQIPLYVGWRILNLDVFNLRIQAGPSVNFIVNKKIETTEADGWIDPIKEANIKSVQWNFQAGAGIDVFMFALNVNYFIGLNKILDGVTVDGEPIRTEGTQQGFFVTLGWKIF